MRLSDEQREALAEEIRSEWWFTDSSEDIALTVIPLIEQWISEAVTDALESGNLPDGWERIGIHDLLLRVKLGEVTAKDQVIVREVGHDG